MYKYNKKILKMEAIDIFNQEYTVYVLDDEDCYDIHIENDKYKDEETNTIWNTHSKEIVTLDELDKVYLYETVVAFALWDKFYGYKDSLYTFDIASTKEPLEV